MHQSVNQFDFSDAFRKIRPGNFSRAGLEALFEYLEEAEEGEPKELDVIAICCDFSEYDSAALACSELGAFDRMYQRANSKEEAAIKEEHEESCMEWLRDNGTCIEVEGGGVIVSGH